MDLVFKNKHDFAMSFEKHKTYLGGEVTKRIQEAKFEGYKPDKLRKGDVIVLPIGVKTRPCAIIKVLKDMVVALPMTSSENNHSVIPFNSRFFGEGHFSNDITTCYIDVVKEKFVGILDDKESLNIAISNLKKFVEKL